MVYKLYITNKNYSSWSMRIAVLLQALDIPFEEQMEVMKDGQSGAELGWHAFSPTAKVPCLHDTSAPGGPIVIWETLAIAEYVADAHPSKPVWPPAASQPAARAWARAAAAEMHAGFAECRERMSMSCGVRVELGEPAREVRRELDRLGELWAEGLARFGGPFLAGKEFGAVDAFYAPMAVRLQTFGAAGLLKEESAREYAAMVLKVPAVAEWIEAGTKEVWRETAHDELTLSGRKLLADYRAT